MWFWWFMFCCDILTPIVMIIYGRMMWKHPPKKINGLSGYRTSRSMKNMETWIFAHKYCGKLWWIIGWITLIPSIIIPIPFYAASENAIGIVGGILVTVQVIVLIYSIIPTERALKKTFTDDGVRR